MRVIAVGSLSVLLAAAPFPGTRVNVDAVARETAADIAGLSVALRAYRASRKEPPPSVLDGVTGEQRFFLAWARIWRYVEREDYARSTLATSIYLPPALRANVAAANLDGFYRRSGDGPRPVVRGSSASGVDLVIGSASRRSGRRELQRRVSFGARPPSRHPHCDSRRPDDRQEREGSIAEPGARQHQ